MDFDLALTFGNYVSWSAPRNATNVSFRHGKVERAKGQQRV